MRDSVSPNEPMGPEWGPGWSISPWTVILRIGAAAIVVLAAGWFAYYYYMVSDAPVVCRQSTWNFGQAYQGKSAHLRHRFRLQNLSKETVPILKVGSDCHCLKVYKPAAAIGPGSTIELRVGVDVDDSPAAPFKRAAFVVLGTKPDSTTVRLTVRGTILPRRASRSASGSSDRTDSFLQP